MLIKSLAGTNLLCCGNPKTNLRTLRISTRWRIFTLVCIDVAQNSQNFAVALQSTQRQMPLSESQKWPGDPCCCLQTNLLSGKWSKEQLAVTYRNLAHASCPGGGGISYETDSLLFAVFHNDEYLSLQMKILLAHRWHRNPQHKSPTSTL